MMTVSCAHGHHHKTMDEALYCNRDILPSPEQISLVIRELSPVQVDILRRLVACDEPMTYFKGGYWTLPSIGRGATPQTSWLDEGRWHVQIQSLMALERCGILGRLNTSSNTDYNGPGYPGLRDFVLTEKGLLIARAL